MTLRRHVIGRLLLMAPFIFGVLTLIFVLIKSAPGDPIQIMYGMRPGKEYNPAVVERLRHELGLDQPIPIQYIQWIGRVLTGDLGYSYIYGQTVLKMISDSFMYTIILQSAGFILSLLIAIPAGIVSAAKQHSKTDYILTGGAIFFYSMPWFFYALIMIYVFGLWLGVAPIMGATSLGAPWTLGDFLHHMILPTIVLGTSGAGFLSRIVRSSMLEVLDQTYIMMARSKGLSERVVIFRHAFRNAMLPVTTVAGMYLGFLVSGSAVIEWVFAYPGIGGLIVNASLQRDYPIIMGTSIIVCLSIILAVFLTDILYAFIDPRIRY
jgi:peptide/nickel transport system permease protein